jgi:hypothetical protein
MRIRRAGLYAAGLAAILCVGVAASESGGPMKGGTVELEATKPAVQASPVRLGRRETARWTATTYEAATSEAHKKVLESGRDTTVTGEVVDVSCYLQLGKRGEAHVACATKCIMNGQPIGIVDADDNLTILFAEEHHPRRDGQVDLKQVFVPLIAKTVSVTGMMTEMRGYRALFVQAAEIGGSVKPVVPAPKQDGK